MFENIWTYAIKAKNKKYFNSLIAQSFGALNNERENSGHIQDSGLARNAQGKKYLLYVHVPFCEKLCPYCSFNRYEFEPDIARNYFSALRKELQIYHDYGYDFDSAYIGGGTPTILLDELWETVDLMRRLYSVSELSIETNTNHLTKENIKIFKQMKVNRISVGVQSFNNDILKLIKRFDAYGSGEEIKERLKSALDNSYTLNVDMIFNFPFQTMAMLDNDIDCLNKLKCDQVTFYPLMPSGAVADAFSRGLGEINYRKEKQFYFKILDRLSDYWQPLTVWCFGQNKGMPDEYIVNRDEYAGLGSGSIGLFNGYIYANTFSPRQYIKKLEEGKLPIAFSRRFSEKESLQYGFLMRLFGMSLDVAKFNDKYKVNLSRFMRKELALLEMVGGIARKNGYIALTRKGMYYWVIAMREFFISVNNLRQHCRNVRCN